MNKIVYEGWAARNVHKITGPSYSIGFFDSPIHKCKSNEMSEIRWEDSYEISTPVMDINIKKLFGKECLEPMRLRITIEQIEE